MEFIDGFIDQLVYQTNLYSIQRGRPLNVKRFEILNFIGINFLMGYNKLPSWKHYWATSDDLNVPCVSNTMSRNRFDNILSNLHVQDNSLIPTNNKDKLLKLRPFINYCNEIFSTSYHGTRELSIDESMIIFKGRNCMKQYNPQKPIKRGYKIWCLSDQRGYIKKFSIYQGKDEQLSDEFESFGLGERVVLNLTKNEWNKNKKFFFDNYFTSLPLLEKLKAENSLACGTIRSNRKDVPELSEDKKAPRGSSDYRITNTGIGVYKWKDTKYVMLASNYHGSEITTVTRKDNCGRKKDILCPQVVRDYNCYMGGVDHADQLRTTYGVNRKSKKWWHRIFWGLLDIMFVNSYVVYKQIHGSITLLDFRRSVTQGLLTLRELPKSNKRQSTSTPKNKGPATKRRGKEWSVSKDVRLTNRGIHWPKFVTNRGRCEVCAINGIQSRLYSKCSHCNVFLCCNDKKNCFADYHDIDCS